MANLCRWHFQILRIGARSIIYIMGGSNAETTWCSWINVMLRVYSAVWQEEEGRTNVNNESEGSSDIKNE